MELGASDPDQGCRWPGGWPGRGTGARIRRAASGGPDRHPDWGARAGDPDPWQSEGRGGDQIAEQAGECRCGTVATRLPS